MFSARWLSERTLRRLRLGDARRLGETPGNTGETRFQTNQPHSTAGGRTLRKREVSPENKNTEIRLFPGRNEKTREDSRIIKKMEEDLKKLCEEYSLLSRTVEKSFKESRLPIIASAGIADLLQERFVEKVMRIIFPDMVLEDCMERAEKAWIQYNSLQTVGFSSHQALSLIQAGVGDIEEEKEREKEAVEEYEE